MHTPANIERRRRGQSRGGRSKPNRELAALKERLITLADDVQHGRADRGDAAVIGQLVNTYIRCLGMEMRVREVEDLAREVDELRELVEAGRGGARYGA